MSSSGYPDDTSYKTAIRNKWQDSIEPAGLDKELPELQL
jgi:hypothetical protein